ncbi:signal peptidase I [Streptomyces sp. UNOC14_S4]|uniref:signal peptidase I n=1 Tax=Streptomyces sp. UNOC14_S4 TaxID=2872340 RepID=UPI001E3EA640|nr:signal peptidase I [Streptomyces sp. UNOC14_S4]MCC3766599.1 signal peptidase I [Streptomyces sp. UNOC14_S4]
MDTDEQLVERDRSPSPAGGKEQGSRSSRFSGDPEGGVPEAPEVSEASDAPEGAADAPEVPEIPEAPAPAAGRRGGRVARARQWVGDGGPLRKAWLLLAACMVFLLLLSSFVVQPFLIPSGSMENTLQVGDRVLVNKLAYRFGEQPRRGDVVVFDGRGSFVHDAPAENLVTTLIRKGASSVGLMSPAPTDYVKRVVGIGGDRVTCCDARGWLKVNGQPIDEPYLYPGDTASRVPFDIVVPEGKLWVMGDHRSDSRDSRDHLGEPGGGTVPVGRVIGRADWIGWPFGRIGSLDRTAAFARVPEPGSAGRTGSPHG